MKSLYLNSSFVKLLAFALTIVWMGFVPVTADDSQFPRLMAEAVRASANRVLPSIVVVELVGGAGGTVGELQQDAPTSGVIVDPEGYILASSIVVRRPSASILVVLPDGSRVAATVVAKDLHRDLVLLKAEVAEPLQAIALPKELELQIGQTSIAVGRYGLDASPMVSRGVLSGIDRLDGIALQIDARVTASLYGGLVVDLYGTPLGLLIPAVAEGGAEDSTSWYDSGIAFAIPTDVILKNLSRMKSGNDIKKGVIGIVAKSKDPYANDTELAAIRARSPAEAAGLKAGDTVTSVDGTPVKRHQQIRQVLGRFDAGDSIAVQVDRQGESLSFELTLTDSIPPLRPQRLGIIASDVSVDQQDAPATSQVVVQQVIPGGPAVDKLMVGDVIEKFGDVVVDELNVLRRQLVSSEPDQVIELSVLRGDESQTVSLTPTSIDGSEIGELPVSWIDQEATWSIETLKMPDAANSAAWVKPGENESRVDLGLLVLLLSPGESEPGEALKAWQPWAQQYGVIVCGIAPEANERWQPKEVEVISRFVASIQKSASIAPSAIAVAAGGALAGAKAEAADSMALMVAIGASRTFNGVGISAETRPPAVAIRENDAEASLQILLPQQTDEELPVWGPTLRGAGYPVIQGGSIDIETLLRWARLLQAV